MAHRQRKEIDHLVDMRSYQVGAENQVGFFINEHFEAIYGFGLLFRVEPVGRVLALAAKLKAFVLGLLFSLADRCNRRNGEGNTGDAMVIRLVLIAIQNIGSGEFNRSVQQF